MPFSPSIQWGRGVETHADYGPEYDHQEGLKEAATVRKARCP